MGMITALTNEPEVRGMQEVRACVRRNEHSDFPLGYYYKNPAQGQTLWAYTTQ